MQAKLWTANSLATETKKDPKWMGRWLQENVEPVKEIQEKGRVKRLYAFSDVFAAALHGDRKKIDVNLERGKKEAAQREKIELEIQVMRGELVSWPMVVQVWNAMISKLRARLLAFPGIMAVKVSVLETYEECKDSLEEGMHDVLKELAEADEEIPDLSVADAPAPTNGKSVGGPGEASESGGERGTGDMAN